jgi:hypothetical protein
MSKYKYFYLFIVILSIFLQLSKAPPSAYSVPPIVNNNHRLPPPPGGFGPPPVDQSDESDDDFKPTSAGIYVDRKPVLGL